MVTMKQKGLLIALFCVVVIYFGCGFALDQGLPIPALLYWFSFLAIPAISLFLASDNERFILFLLILNSISVYSLFLLQNTTWFPAARDTQYELQIANLIRNTGKWVPGLGTGFSSGSSFNPGMHIFIASFSAVTGTQTYDAMFLIPWLRGVGFLLFFYLFAREFFSNVRIRFFASLVCLGAVWFISFPHRELFSEIFFMGALWLCFRKETSPKTKLLLVILTFSMTLSHHFTSYVFLAPVIAVFLFDHERRKKMINPLIPVVIVFSWISFVTITISSGFVIEILQSLETVVTFRLPSGQQTLAATRYFYTPFENLMVFLGPILTGLVAFYPFLKAIRSKKMPSLTAITFVFGILLGISALFFILNTQMGTSFLRIWGFVYIPLAIWVGLFFSTKVRNPRVLTIVTVIFVVILFASMNLSSVDSGIKKWYVPRTYIEAYMVSDSMVNTAYWCKEYVNGSIIGDHFAYDMVGSWGYKNVAGSDFQAWYQTKDNEYLKGYDYLIFSPWDTVTYLDTFRVPIDPYTLLPDNLSLVYTSGDLVIYRIPH